MGEKPSLHKEALRKIAKLFTVNRIALMRAHYDALAPQLAPKGEKERRELAYFQRAFERYSRKAARLIKIRLLLYLFLYASIAINVLKTIPLLSLLVDFIAVGSALFSTTVLFGLVLWMTLRINVQVEAMTQCLAHVIAIYHKNPRRDVDATIKRLRRKL